MVRLSFYILVLFSLLSSNLYARSVTDKVKVVSTSLASDEIIFSLMEASSSKEKFDVYYSYIAYNQDYSNISDLIPKDKIFHINKESLFIKDPDLIFLSPYNKAEFLDSVSSYSDAKAFTINPSSTMDELSSNILLIGKSLGLSKEASVLNEAILNSMERIKKNLSGKNISVLTYMPHNITVSSYTLIDDIFTRIGVRSITKDYIGYASLDEERLFLNPGPDYLIFISPIYSDEILNFALEKSFLKRIKISSDHIIYIPEKLAFCTSNYIVELIKILDTSLR